MNDILKISLLWIALSGVACAVPTCRVLDPELQDRYVGACNQKGLADGTGEAWGVAHYKGHFTNGMKDGLGVKDWPVTGDRFEGRFMDDRRNGWGRYIWGTKSPWFGSSYEGEYRLDMREGEGVYFWPNGDKYFGTWHNDQHLGLSVMESRREERESSVAKAYASLGMSVCREATGDFGQAVLLSGVVAAHTGDHWEIDLDPASVALGVMEGAQVQLDTHSLLAWFPCHVDKTTTPNH